MYGYHWAFFCVDGKTHNFAFKPGFQTNTWYDRKSRHSIQALVTNDIHLRVRHLVVGWPGGTHDARVMRSADYMVESRKNSTLLETSTGWATPLSVCIVE